MPKASRDVAPRSLGVVAKTWEWILSWNHRLIMKTLLSILLVLFALPGTGFCQTYAERLGFPKGAKVVILHVDDVGMSYDSNIGAIRATEDGVATSMSVMMPCPWVPGFLRYLKTHPKADAGLHLTLTSEWRDYRWGPVSGRPAVPGLVDAEGAMWRRVEDVATNAQPPEVAQEISGQLAKARSMGFEPTHLDTHMGTLFARPEFLEEYLKLGMEQHIPVMFPGGHNSMISKESGSSGLSKGQTTAIGERLWAAGLPVLDDLHNVSYGFHYPKDKELTDEQLQELSTRQYIQSFKQLQPGVTMVIMHCTATTEVFEHISDSGNTRRGDLLAMLSPELKKYLADSGIILTTWRELKARRDKV
jgi:chitin disaccharide deacetylase